MLFIVFSICLLRVIAAHLSDDVVAQEWTNFKVRWNLIKLTRMWMWNVCLYSQIEFNKSYTELENDFRSTIFMHNWKRAAQHNRDFVQNKSSFRMGLNKYSDLTPYEHQMLRGLMMPVNSTFEANSSAVSYIGANNVRLPQAINWTDMGAVTEVKDQGEWLCVYPNHVCSTRPHTFNVSHAIYIIYIILKSDISVSSVHDTRYTYSPPKNKACADHVGHSQRPVRSKVSISVRPTNWFHCPSRIWSIARGDMAMRAVTVAGWTAHSSISRTTMGSTPKKVIRTSAHLAVVLIVSAGVERRWEVSSIYPEVSQKGHFYLKILLTSISLLNNYIAVPLCNWMGRTGDIQLSTPAFSYQMTKQNCWRHWQRLDPYRWPSMLHVFHFNYIRMESTKIQIVAMMSSTMPWVEWFRFFDGFIFRFLFFAWLLLLYSQLQSSQIDAFNFVQFSILGIHISQTFLCLVDSKFCVVICLYA